VVLWQNARLELQYFWVITFLIMMGTDVVFASPIRWTRWGRFRHFRLISHCWNNDTSLCNTIRNKSVWGEDMQWCWYGHETTVFFLDEWRTVHHSITLVNLQPDA